MVQAQPFHENFPDFKAIPANFPTQCILEDSFVQNETEMRNQWCENLIKKPKESNWQAVFKQFGESGKGT
ncbi:MAG: hypothetical protein ACKOS8_10770 [Gemmataceae bacterium]